MHGSAGVSGSDRTEPPPRGYRVGRWEVGELIGAGGWSTVHSARAVDDGEEVALKFLQTAGLAPRQARKVAESARREVELGRRARHPRLIRLLDSLVLSDPDRPSLDGAIVLVMERARCSLRDLLDTGVTEGEAARLIVGICEGLAHLHGSGWVHGDLKPENVLIMADGSVRLSDFGLATELTGTQGTHGYAPPMGTVDYLPPERWKAPLGERGVQIRPSVDIWALGVMIHEAFASGAPPFPGATPVSRGAAAQEYAEGRARLRLRHELPPFWRALVTDCLAPTHAARARHTAESLLARITALRSTDPGAARPEDHRRGGARNARSTRSARNAHRTRRDRTAVALLKVCVTTAALWSFAVGDGAAASAGGPAAPAGRIQVFNADATCRQHPDRAAQCSLGLAIDPMRAYTVENVVPTRVWNGDVLDADCLLSDGTPIIDETDTVSADWFRVHLPAGSPRTTAWLPAVRTKDRPALPACPRPSSRP
ncbi:serine/threonine-protein kinase [Streptomyces sp. NPDC059443]|uniref:serine/threonine-protein kinase n=1 Tax=unclassified Streptomyces TaxID=2593676 RepID=UPI0036CABCB4